jgi:hypothetical protein
MCVCYFELNAWVRSIVFIVECGVVRSFFQACVYLVFDREE